MAGCGSRIGYKRVDTMSSEESRLVEFVLEFNKEKEQRFLSQPEGRIYITNLPGQEEDSKLCIMPADMEPGELTTYIDLMIVNLKRLKTQAKKKLSAYRRRLR